MSCMPVNPASTRLEIGQETNSGSRSTSTTSIDGSHRRRYLAAVAPPKPPPSTTTRPRERSVLAQPPADKAAADAENFRKARRLNAFMPGSSALQRGEPGRQLLDLRVGIALGDLVHYGGRALAVAEAAQLRRQLVARHAGKRGEVLGRGLAAGTVTDGAGRGEVAAAAVLRAGERHGAGD